MANAFTAGELESIEFVRELHRNYIDCAKTHMSMTKRVLENYPGDESLMKEIADSEARIAHSESLLALTDVDFFWDVVVADGKNARSAALAEMMDED